MRVQNEQLAARLFAVEQRNAEMASDHGQSALAHTQPPPCPPPPNPWRRPRWRPLRLIRADVGGRCGMGLQRGGPRWRWPKVAHPTAFHRTGAREQRAARRRGGGRAAYPSRRPSCAARRRRAAHAADTRPLAALHARLGGAAESARGARLRRGAAQAEPPAAGEPHEHTASGERLGSGEGEGLEQRLQSGHAPTQRRRQTGHRRQR